MGVKRWRANTLYEAVFLETRSKGRRSSEDEKLGLTKHSWSGEEFKRRDSTLKLERKCWSSAFGELSVNKDRCRVCRSLDSKIPRNCPLGSTRWRKKKKKGWGREIREEVKGPERADWVGSDIHSWLRYEKVEKGKRTLKR